jgi:hypothetical protein
LYDSLWHFLTIGIGGGFLALLFGQYTKEREERERDRSIRRDMFKELLVAYSKAKKVQRLMRARAICGISDGKLHVLCDEYDKLFDDLNDARLSFETQVHQIRANSRLFPDEPKLTKNLLAMEEYLALTIQEHQKIFWRSSGSPRKRLLSDLRALENFLGYNSLDNEFRTEFKYPFRDAMEDFGPLL